MRGLRTCRFRKSSSEGARDSRHVGLPFGYGLRPGADGVPGAESETDDWIRVGVRRFGDAGTYAVHSSRINSMPQYRSSVRKN